MFQHRWDAGIWTEKYSSRIHATACPLYVLQYPSTYPRKIIQSGRYASYQNAFLFFGKFLHIVFWLYCRKKEPDTDSDKQLVGCLLQSLTTLRVFFSFCLRTDFFFLFFLQLETNLLFSSICLRTVLENLFKSCYIDIKVMLTEMPEWCGLKRKSYT